MNEMPSISEVSGDGAPVQQDEFKRVKNFVRGMLKTKLFVGIFQEKRFVQPLNAYRALIRLADDETELAENLLVSKKRLLKFYRGQSIWIGITDPDTIGAPTGYNLWVELDSEILGPNWYNIKNVEFRGNEICLKLKTVRPYKRETTPTTTHSLLEGSSSFFDYSEIQDNVANLIREKITVHNIKESIVFLGLFVMTILTFLVHTVKYFMEYFLKLLHELQGIIKVSSPVLKLVIQSISDCVRALISFLFTLVSPSQRHLQPPPHQYYITMGENFNAQDFNHIRRGLPALGPAQGYQRQPTYQRPGVTITPLD